MSEQDHEPLTLDEIIIARSAYEGSEYEQYEYDETDESKETLPKAQPEAQPQDQPPYRDGEMDGPVSKKKTIMTGKRTRRRALVATRGSDIPRIHRSELPAPPKTWKKMKESIYTDWWTKAATDQYEDLTKQGTFVLTATDAVNIEPLPLMWVFTYKTDKHGYLKCFKARRCVRWDLQPWNSLNTYTATLAGRLFQTLIAIAARVDLETHFLDAVNTFAHRHGRPALRSNWGWLAG